MRSKNSQTYRDDVWGGNVVRTGEMDGEEICGGGNDADGGGEASRGPRRTREKREEVNGFSRKVGGRGGMRNKQTPHDYT